MMAFGFSCATWSAGSEVPMEVGGWTDNHRQAAHSTWRPKRQPRTGGDSLGYTRCAPCLGFRKWLNNHLARYRIASK